jgi:hypothetical protein
MRRLGFLLPLALVLPLVVAPAARVAPAPPPPTPSGLIDVVPAPPANAVVEGPVGGPLGISILGFGRLALSPGTSLDLPGPQALVVVAGSPVVTPIAGIVIHGRAGGEHGRALIVSLPAGEAVRLQPGDWLFLRAGGACVVTSDGPDEVIALVAMLTGGPAAE